MGSASFAGLPIVYKTWVTLVCLLLDTPLGRRLVKAVPLITGGNAQQLIKLPRVFFLKKQKTGRNFMWEKP